MQNRRRLVILIVVIFVIILSFFAGRYYGSRPTMIQGAGSAASSVSGSSDHRDGIPPDSLGSGTR